MRDTAQQLVRELSSSLSPFACRQWNHLVKWRIVAGERPNPAAAAQLSSMREERALPNSAGAPPQCFMVEEYSLARKSQLRE